MKWPKRGQIFNRGVPSYPSFGEKIADLRLADWQTKKFADVLFVG